MNVGPLLSARGVTMIRLAEDSRAGERKPPPSHRPEVTDIFHISHVINLERIIQCGGLYCDRLRIERQLATEGIAHEHIKERRARRRVPTCQHGTLADYVPFYFAPRSPMLYSIHGAYVEQYRDGQRPVVHLSSSAELIAEAGIPFTFTEGHAELAYSSFTRTSLI